MRIGCGKRQDMIRSRVLSFCFIIVCSACVFAQTAQKASSPNSVERVDKLLPVVDNMPRSVIDAVEDSGYAVKLDGKPFAQIWLAKSVPDAATSNTSAVYPQLAKGTFLGVVVFNETVKDFRGQPIKPYLYSMRYDLLPSDGNHMGAAAQPDFVLLLYISSGGPPSKVASESEMLSGSRAASGTNHPATFSLVPADAVKEFPSVFKNDVGFDVFAAKLNVGGKPMPIAIVLRGQAAQ